MANPKNLKPQAHKLTVEEASKGGKISAAKRAERKTIREGLLLLLDQPAKDKDGNETDKTMQDAIIAGLVRKAARGDTRAFELIRDTIGEKPVETVKVTTTDKTIMDEIRSRMDADIP